MRCVETKNFDLIYSSYQNDFPIDEQKSYEKVNELINQNVYRIVLAMDEEIKGYIIGIKGERFFWMDYLATFKQFRGQHIGTNFLKKMVEEYHTIIFEVESWDGVMNSETYRREQFYRSVGGYALDVPYELPTPSGSMKMNLWIISDCEYDHLELKEFVRKCELTIHSDFKHTPNVINKYIDKI